jgi:hypothetical protein
MAHLFIGIFGRVSWVLFDGHLRLVMLDIGHLVCGGRLAALAGCRYRTYVRVRFDATVCGEIRRQGCAVLPSTKSRLIRYVVSLI